MDTEPLPEAISYLSLFFPLFLVLLLFSALFSGFEVAFFSLNSHHLNQLKKKKRIYRHIFDTFLQHPHQLLASILIGNNFVNLLLIISVATITQNWKYFLPEWLLFLVDVTFGTIIILLFGEIFPKLIANSAKERFLLLTSWIIYGLFWLFYPLSYLFTLLTKMIRPRRVIQENLSKKELLQLVERAPEDIAPAEEKRLLRSLIQMETLQVRAIMTPRTEIVAVPEDMELQELLSFVQGHRFARYPVYGKDLDDIKGILFVKDLLKIIYQPSTSEPWQNKIRPPFFIPESSTLLSLLTHFKNKRVNIAIVVDEYGGCAGLVTLSDLLHNFFGITEPMLQQVNETTFLVDGQTTIVEFCRTMQLAEDYFEPYQGESETIAGLFLEVSGEIPKVGSKIKIKNFEFTVNQVNNFVIKKLLVKKLDT